MEYPSSLPALPPSRNRRVGRLPKVETEDYKPRTQTFGRRVELRKRKKKPVDLGGIKLDHGLQGSAALLKVHKEDVKAGKRPEVLVQGWKWKTVVDLDDIPGHFFDVHHSITYYPSNRSVEPPEPPCMKALQRGNRRRQSHRFSGHQHSSLSLPVSPRTPSPIRPSATFLYRSSSLSQISPPSPHYDVKPVQVETREKSTDMDVDEMDAESDATMPLQSEPSETQEDVMRGIVEREEETFGENVSKLVVLVHRRKRKMKTWLSYLVAFPVGPKGKDLNVSRIFPRNTIHAFLPGPFFQAQAESAMKFETSILQIVGSEAGSDEDAGSHLAVRTRQGTWILSVTDHPAFDPTLPAIKDRHVHDASGAAANARVDLVVHIDTSHTENRKHVDVSLHPTKRQTALIVDQGGGVWKWSVDGKETEGKMECIRPASETSPGEGDGFYRVKWGVQNDTVVVASSKTVELIHLGEDSSTTSTILLSLENSDSFITGLEATTHGSLSCMTTTENLALFDESKPGQAILSWEHHRNEDRSTRPTTRIENNISNHYVYSNRDLDIDNFRTLQEDQYFLTALKQETRTVRPMRKESNVQIDSLCFMDLANATDVTPIPLLLVLFSDGRLDAAFRTSSGSEMFNTGKLEKVQDNQDTHGTVIALEATAPKLDPTRAPKTFQFGTYWQALLDRIPDLERTLKVGDMKRFYGEFNEDGSSDPAIPSLLDIAVMSLDKSEDNTVTSQFLRSYNAVSERGRVIQENGAAYERLLEDIKLFSRNRDTLQSLPNKLVGQLPDFRLRAFGDALATRKLSTDLYLSSLLRAPEPDVLPTSLRQQSPAPDSPGNDLAAFTESALQLEDSMRRFEPRLINIRRGKASLAPVDDDSTVGTLMDQWKVGEDPNVYAWIKPTSAGDDEPIQPPVPTPQPKKRALATSKSLQLPSFNSGSPSGQFSDSLPTQPAPSSQRASALSAANEESLAATQITRGPFGDRTAHPSRRLPLKKRTVGF